MYTMYVLHSNQILLVYSNTALVFMFNQYQMSKHTSSWDKIPCIFYSDVDFNQELLK